LRAEYTTPQGTDRKPAEIEAWTDYLVAQGDVKRRG
jgi:hypothetical protein